MLCNTNTNTRPYVFTLSYIHNPCTCIRIGRPVPARLENGNGDFSASLAKWGQKLCRSETEPEPHWTRLITQHNLAILFEKTGKILTSASCVIVAGHLVLHPQCQNTFKAIGFGVQACGFYSSSYSFPVQAILHGVKAVIFIQRLHFLRYPCFRMFS